MKRLCLAAALAAAAVIGAAPASATITLATYTGTITGGNQSSYDVTGVFGTPNAALGGLAYRVVYRIDDSLPGAPFYFGPQGPNRDISELLGGSSYGIAAIPVTATITIGGVSVAIGGENASVDLQTFRNFQQTLHYVDGQVAALGAGNAAYVTEIATLFGSGGFLNSQDLRAPLDVDLTGFPAGQAGGGFSIYENNGGGYHWAFGQLRAEHLTIATAGAVPEPAAWSLMIAGFGLIGAALRRRNPIAALQGAL